MRFDPRIVSVPRNFQYHPRMVMQHIPSRAEIKEKFSGASGITLACWLISSLIAIIAPVTKWAKERRQYYKYMGRYNEYAWKQRQYEQMQNGNGNWNNMGSYCSWWNYKCRQRAAAYQWYMQGQQNGGQNRNGGNVMRMPGWYTFFGGRVETEGEDENMHTGSNAAMKFVYAWNIIMFIGLTIYGYRVLANGKDRMGLIVALLIYAQFSLMNLITTTQGAIETNDRFFENSIYGWFGQYSVLVAYTDFWMFLHSMIFAIVIGAVHCCDRSQKEERAADVSESLDVYKQDGVSFDEVLTQREEADYVHA